MLRKKSAKNELPKKKVRLSSIKTERDVLAFVRSRSFESYLRKFIFTQVYVSKRELSIAQKNAALFKKFFLEHNNEQIRTLANKKYERVMKSLMGAKE